MKDVDGQRVSAFEVTNNDGSIFLLYEILMGVFVKPSVLKDRSLSESEKINLMLAREGKVEIDDWRRRWAELMAASGFAPSAGNKNPNNTNDSSKSNNKKKKKKVTFADCQGHQLATVKVMTEPSDVPPRLSASVLRAHGIPVSENDEEDMVDGRKSAAQNPASWHLGLYPTGVPVRGFQAQDQRTASGLWKT
ncbi:conserved hypothetical protein [Trichinella spiralis]|uniref:hypothetical protein n=1 Tax=Trichinella spiralis TaxID=6334 RepID=UPI0001EFDCC7|nr:conserved hypothetical protein [Trichinella spiralis]